MHTVIAPRGDARTFLTHFTGGGLDDDRYAVQRFRSLANGDIVPVHADGRSRRAGARRGRRPYRRRRSRRCGRRAMGIFTDRRQRG